MTEHFITLSTTEPNNYVGLLKMRQGDTNTQEIEATITANGQLFKFDRLSVFFNAVLPNGNVIRDKVTEVNYVNSKLNYVVADSFLQEVAQVTAWFSFENGEKIIDSTKNFQYSVIGGWKECIPQGNYIYELSEIQREIEEIISNKDFTTLLSELDFLKTNIAYLDNNIKTIKADLNNSINDKLSQISSVPETFANLAALKSTYPTGKPGLFVTADTGHKYIWANNVWADAGVYQSVGIADGSISPAKFDDSIKQNFFEYDTLYVTPKSGFYSTVNKIFNSSGNYLSVTSACKPGELFSCSTNIKPSSIAVVMFFKDESCIQYHSHLLGGVVGVYNDYVFTIPEGVAGFAVTSTVDFRPVIKKCNPVAIKDFMQKTENQLSLRFPLSGELSNGFYSTVNAIFNADDNYKSLKAKVSAGDKIYFNAVCSTNTIATCVFWDVSGNKLLTLKGGEIGTWVNVEAIAPTNTDFVTITSTADNPPSATIQQPFNAASYLESITALPETFANLAAIEAKYPSGNNGLMVAADNGHKYIWANNTWTDAGIYRYAEIADGSISPAKFDDSIKQNFFEYDTLYVTPKSGFYSTVNKIFNSSGNYLSVTSACKPGELFSCSTNIKPSSIAVVMFFKDESCIQYHSHLLGGVVGVYNDYVFTIPEGVAGFAVTSTVDFRPVIKKCNPVAIKDFMKKTENQLSSVGNITSKPLMFNRKLDDRLEILSKYNTTKDLELSFGKVSANHTWQFSGASLLDNTEKSVNIDFDRTKENYINVYTDYVSPINTLRAINNINGDQPDSTHFTGGWHGYNNNNSGTATARTISCKVFVDGYELGNEIVSGYETKLVITNLIQGTNTKKVDGSGREILQEKITYTIVCGNINIEAEYTALEDLTLNGYYFLQFQLVDRFGSKFIAYDDDSHRSWIDDFSLDIDGGDKTISSTNCMQFVGENDKCTMFYDPNFGIGRLQYNNRLRWLYRNYKKAYFNLIDRSGSPVTFKSGEVFVCRGGYKFEAL